MKRRPLRLAIALLFLLTVLFAFEAPAVFASYGNPVPVEGRILSRDKTDDSSAWIEIAQYGNYSLIIRQEPVGGSDMRYNTALVNAYQASIPRKSINDWYRYTLNSNARLRNFAVTSNAMGHLGSYGTDYMDGLSIPLGGAAPTGDDVAFALSFCESVLYCSTQYNSSWTNAKIILSSREARNNYLRLLPTYYAGGKGPAYWLRTPGTSYTLAGCVGFQGGVGSNGTPYTYDEAIGRVNQDTVIGAFGYGRPAMWVGNGIFDDKGTVVVRHLDIANGSSLRADETYSVSPGYYGPYGEASIPNYDYVGLASGSASISGTINAGETKTIIHQYRRAVVSYNVNYFPNGGIGSDRSYSVQANQTHTVLNQNYTPPANYVFDSWNTRSDGYGTRYEIGNVITVTGDINLYARWRNVDNTQMVVYYPNDGNGTVQVDYTDNTGRITIVNKYFTKPGYVFSHWNTQPGGSGTDYYVGQQVTLNATLILFAQYTRVVNKYSITYHPGYGSGNMTIDGDLTEGSSYTIRTGTSAGVSRPFYRFLRWCTTLEESYGGQVYLPGSTITVDRNLLLFAIWERID